MRLATLLPVLAMVPAAFAQHKRNPFGMAAGTTGGGSATPIWPNTNAELVALLTDNQPRVIMIDKTFQFLETEGSTSGRCCILNKCSSGTGHQSYIGDTCDGGTWESCTYWNAPRNPIDVKSNKSLVGVGANAAIRGKALRLRGGVSNIIIQGIHFYDLNPKHVWGGDAITLDGCDRVWIDHCKFSLVGRQFIVSGWGPAGHVTISDNEFDGRTSWSSSCNGKHYWGLLLIGETDYYTLAGNYFHDLSGRAPHLGTGDPSKIVGHVINNYFENIDGHALDIEENTHMLIEGNFFQNVKQPITPASATNGGEIYYIQTVNDASYAQGALGFIPEWNRNGGTSGSIPTMVSTPALQRLGEFKSNIQWEHWKVENVPNNVKANAGVGKA